MMHVTALSLGVPSVASARLQQTSYAREANILTQMLLHLCEDAHEQEAAAFRCQEISDRAVTSQVCVGMARLRQKEPRHQGEPESAVPPQGLRRPCLNQRMHRALNLTQVLQLMQVHRAVSKVSALHPMLGLMQTARLQVMQWALRISSLLGWHPVQRLLQTLATQARQGMGMLTAHSWRTATHPSILRILSLAAARIPAPEMSLCAEA